MASLSRLLERHLRNSSAGLTKSLQQHRLASQRQFEADDDQTVAEGEFRVLNLRGRQQQRETKKRPQRLNKPLPPPRTERMKPDQNWGNIWPGPRTFHPDVVPLPLRMGYTEKGAAPPGKYANAELMKIPNFLHLTPPVVKRQCEAIKKFCTAWPKELDTDEKCRWHFPVEVQHTDYCHALPTIRHPEARRITLRIKLSDLQFDSHAKDKFLRLVGDRYNSATDMLTIMADRCPLRKQNYDYAMYLLTACYHESFITEPWEASKSEADMEYYHFERNKSKQSAEAILNWGQEEKAKVPVSEEFGQSVELLINDGENEYNLRKYKEQVIKMLGIGNK